MRGEGGWMCFWVDVDSNFGITYVGDDGMINKFYVVTLMPTRGRREQDCKPVLLAASRAKGYD